MKFCLKYKLIAILTYKNLEVHEYVNYRARYAN